MLSLVCWHIDMWKFQFQNFRYFQRFYGYYFWYFTTAFRCCCYYSFQQPLSRRVKLARQLAACNAQPVTLTIIHLQQQVAGSSAFRCCSHKCNVALRPAELTFIDINMQLNGLCRLRLMRPLPEAVCNMGFIICCLKRTLQLLTKVVVMCAFA